MERDNQQDELPLAEAPRPRPSVMIVDDEDVVRRSLLKTLRKEGFELYSASSAMDALLRLEEEPMDVVVSDQYMPGLMGVDFLEVVALRWPRSRRVLLSAFMDLKTAMDAVNRGKVHGLLVKPISVPEFRQTIRSQLAEDPPPTLMTVSSGKDVDLNSLQAVIALGRAVDARDKSTQSHSVRVSRISQRIASAMGISVDVIETIRTGALLHDVGKIGIRDEVLLKPGRLSDEEFDAIRRHPEIGGAIVRPLSLPQDAIAIVECHHERWDGRGYPHRLKGEETPLVARIVSAADAYEAMTARRVYRDPLSSAIVREQIKKGRGSQFDAQVADILISLIDREDESLRPA